MISPGSGVLPVGQFDAQKRFPKGSGMPSFASSGVTVASLFFANVFGRTAQKALTVFVALR